MINQQNFPELIDMRRKERGVTEIGVKALHLTAARFADMRRTGTHFKTMDFVGLLLCHGARSRRASLPAVGIHLNVRSPSGKSALKINLEKIKKTSPSF